MNKGYAVFDMDGTLVDSMAFWRRLGREYLAGKGVTAGVDAVLERTRPMTMTESAALFIAEFHLPGTAESVAAEMNAVMDLHYRKDIPLKAGVREYLSRLRRSGVRMCVASATAPDLMEVCLRRLDVAGYFDFLLSCEEVGAGKDRPDVFLEAANRLAAQPREIAVYEDSLHAARTAAEAGFYTVAVYDNSNQADWAALEALADEAISDWSAAAREL